MKADTLASFPGSPRTQTKNRTERGEPDKIYHVRNVIHVGRDNLIPQRVAFKALLWPFLGFAQVFSVLIVGKKLPERAPTKTRLRVLSIIDRSAITCVG